MTITEMLDQLADFYAQRDLLSQDEQRAIDTVLTPEIRQAVEDIKFEFAEKGAAVAANVADLEAEIKAQVKALGTTFKGAALQAVWSRGRVSWDTKGLDGFVVAHPELAVFRKEGEPSVSIRINGK